MRIVGSVLLAGALLAAPAVASAANNPYGIMTMSGGGSDTTGMLYHLKLAREFCGEWGYIRTGGDLRPEAVDEAVRTIVGARAMHLIPVWSAFRVPDEYWDPENRESPKADPDGSLTTFGNAYEKWARAIYERGLTIPYFEYGNEVNGGYYGDHPEVYARMCIAVSQALKRVDPKISFGTAGMAGCGCDFYDKMLTLVPELKDHVDHWGLHPYAANHPPHYTDELGDYGVGSHTYLYRVLRSHGVRRPVFIMTETGYELGNEKDRRFPKITERLRAEYLVQAYKEIWAPDRRVRGVMPFMLQDTNWSGWDGWDFIREDFTRTPMYDAIAALPKPKGEDYMPRGRCSVRGRIVDSDLGRGVENYLVWIRRPNFGCYAAATDEDGGYVIANVPPGRYLISGFADGFGSTPIKRITLRKTATLNFRVKRTGFFGDFQPAGDEPVPIGWKALSGEGGYAIDREVKRTGEASQRIEANRRFHGIWNITGYQSCLPDHVYAAEVCVKTKGLVLGDKPGVGLTLHITDSYNRVLASAAAAFSDDGDHDWRPLTVAFKSVPKGRRLRVELTVEADSGTVWFDDPFLHDADWPPPSAYGLVPSPEPGSEPISGVVFGPGGNKRLGKATVWTVPLGRWAITDWLGRFTLDGLPPGRYDLWASHPNFVSGSARGVATDDPKRIGVTLSEVPVPDHIINADFEDIPSHPTWFGDWNRWGSTEGIQTAGWFTGLASEDYPDGFQPHSGNGFYGAVAGSNIKDGGIYQTIAVERDALYEVAVWSQTYQTKDGRRGDVANRLGVDPMGGKNPNSPYVIWTPYRGSHKRWTRLSLRVRPVHNRITVFLHHLQVQGLVFNCNFFDDVEVKRVGDPKKTMWSDQ